jgi:glycosyltransferase involved in cell wall biosynthesis
VALGELRNPLLRRAAERMERWLYRHSSRVLVTTTAFVADLTSRGVPAGHIVHVPNGARLDVFRPDVETAGVRGPLGLDGHFVVTYAGLHGIAQDLETVLDAAARLAPDNRFRFLFIGDGPRKVALESTARSMGLANVTFMAAVPVETCAAYLAASDVLLVPLAANVLFRMFVPSKLFDGLACGRPVVLMVDGEARAILERSGGGRFVPPGDAAALASTLTAMADHPAGLAEMGARGRTFVETHYSREAQARDVVRTVREVAGLAEAS